MHKWTGNSFLLGSSSLANQAGSFYLSLHCYCWWCVMVLRGFSLLAKSHQKIKLKTKTVKMKSFILVFNLSYSKEIVKFLYLILVNYQTKERCSTFLLCYVLLAIFGQIFLWLMVTLATSILPRETLGPKYVRQYSECQILF
jgi:hypothetical protein